MLRLRLSVISAIVAIGIVLSMADDDFIDDTWVMRPRTRGDRAREGSNERGRFSQHELRIIDLLRRKGYLPRTVSETTLSRSRFQAAVRDYDERSVIAKPNSNASLITSTTRSTTSTARPTRTTTQAEDNYADDYLVRSHCSPTALAHAPDGDDLCAIVYLGTHCRGDKLYVKPGYATRRLPDKWRKSISSAQLRPHCRLQVCTKDNMHGYCAGMIGETNGRNFDTIRYDFDGRIRSMHCTCSEEEEEDE